MIRQAPRIALAVALLAVLIAGWVYNTRAPSPAGGTEPSSLPPTVMSHGICTTTAQRPSAHEPSQLPKTASSADLLWYPGMNARPCRLYRTRLDATQADRLLDDLHAAKGPSGNGVSNCPEDDGSFVQVWFHTPSASPSFRIDLTGCSWYLPDNPADLGPWPYTPPF